MSSNLWNNPVSGQGVGASGFSSQPDQQQFMGGQNPSIPAGFADYTGTATRFEDTDIYRKAVNISEAQPCDMQGMAEEPAPFQEKVRRRVEVPYTRTVKVPVKTTKLVPTTVTTQVPIRKLVQVPSFTVVDEEYTVFEEREAVREKEIWIKQVVPETYMEKVPVVKTRQVQRPTKEIREVEELISIQVPTNRAVEVDGFRIDEVEDTKVVEVDEYQTYNWQKQPTDDRTLAMTREIGRVPGSHIARNVGRDVLDPNDRMLGSIDTDSTPDNAQPVNYQQMQMQMQMQGQRGPEPMSNTGSYYRKQGEGFNVPDALPGDAQVAFSNDNFTDHSFLRPAGGQPKINPAFRDAASGSIGLSVKNTHTRHTDGTGVLVTKVERGGPCARAGLQESDIITSVQNIPTSTVEEFSAVLKKVAGPVALTVNRDGRRNISLTLYR